MSKTKTKVAVALSGGLDSSVCCHLLKKQGYDVVALTAKMTDDANFEQIVLNAEKAANNIGVPHYVADLTKEFKKGIIDYFENSYKCGKTPNPCILCNKSIKFGALLDYALENLNADFIATGHYARIINDKGIYKLFPAADTKKDQLYYLFELTQKQLSHTIFPLHCYIKEDIRKIAIENNLPSKSSKESQDICFIKKPMTAKKYLLEKIPMKQGRFIHIKTGEKLGTHEGFCQYTIGQRKGVGIAYSEPLYVAKIDAEKNIVYLGGKEDILENSVKISKVNLQYPQTKQEFDALVKIRYNMDFQKAHVQLSENNKALITFETPVSAVTPGQAAVFYSADDKHLIGGGWID